MKVKPIGDVMKTVLTASLTFFKTQVLKRLEGNEKAYKGVQVAFIPIENSIKVLNDDVAENKEQVSKVALDWVNQPLSDYLDDIFTDLIEKHDDENVEKLLFFCKGIVLGVLKVYSDDDLQNNVQMKNLFQGVLQDPQTEILVLNNVFKPLLEKKIKDTETVNYIISILDKAFDGIQKK